MTRSKSQMTQAKRERERALLEKRARKQAKKDARKAGPDARPDPSEDLDPEAPGGAVFATGWS